MTEFHGPKNLLITQHKIGYSCTLFSKVRVCQVLLWSQMYRIRLFRSLVRSGHNHRWCGL